MIYNWTARLQSRLFEKERDWSHAVHLESRGPLLALCVCFHRIAGADEVAIAVDVVDAGHRRPELVIAKVGQWEGGLLA